MSLFTRVIGLNDPQVPIPIHLVQSLLSELEQGRISFAKVAEIMVLDSVEQTDLLKVLNHVTAAPDALIFSSRVFNYLVLGEMDIVGDRDYTDEALFWQMLEDEAPLP